MTDNTEKLIADAITAFTDRELTPPSRDDLRIALQAFEASLARCGCEACTTARRERIALTSHDRTALARVLHEIVYSPGANYDRAVPGIQEYMLACAEKVAAALPWMTPPADALEAAEEVRTPADDERGVLRAEAEKVQRAAWAEIHGQDPQRTYSVAEVKRIVYSFDNVLSSALCRSERPSAEDRTPRDFQAYELTVDMLEDLLVTAEVKPSEHGITIRKTAGALVYKIGACLTREPQGEPSDAQVAAIRELEMEIPGAYVRDDMDGPVIILTEQAAKTALVALRAASAVTEQGENRDE